MAQESRLFDHLTRPNVVEMRFSVGWKLRLNYTLLSNLPFTHLSNNFFVSETCSEVWEQTILLYSNDTQMSLWCVSKSPHSCCFHRFWLYNGRNIWVNFMLFIMILMSYCLLPALRLKNHNKDPSSSCYSESSSTVSNFTLGYHDQWS